MNNYKLLRANLRKACLALGAPLKTVLHPYLEGVKCRADGAVFLPASAGHPGHWTYGYRMPHGYLAIRVHGSFYYAHRVVCEAFHGLCPGDKPEVDHINRDRSDNSSANLRWSTVVANRRNTRKCDMVEARGWAHSYEDRKAYGSKRYLAHKSDPKFREIQDRAHRKYRETHRPLRCADGKYHIFTLAEAAKMMKLPVKDRIWVPRR